MLGCKLGFYKAPEGLLRQKNWANIRHTNYRTNTVSKTAGVVRAGGAERNKTPDVQTSRENAAVATANPNTTEREMFLSAQ